MTEPRTVTLPTLDHGSVTLPEPAWCAGHTDHQPGYRADLAHNGPRHRLAFNGQTIGYALISQAPCAERSNREAEASVVLDFEPRHGFDPARLHDLAAALDTAAGRLRALADQLAAILGGGR